MHIAVIDYSSGNLHSVAKVFEKVALEQSSKAKVSVTNKVSDILNASHIVLPGQGAFDDCANALKSNDAIWQALHEAVLKQAKPFFGICVGMQLLADKGLEGQGADGLGWIGGIVDKMQPNDPHLKIPHMGWNTLCVSDGIQSHLAQQAFKDIAVAPSSNLIEHSVYFAHSWAIQNVSSEYILCTVDYGGDIIAAVGRDNILGTQFHPEKSQLVGQKIIRNFLQWRV